MRLLRVQLCYCSMWVVAHRRAEQAEGHRTVRQHGKFTLKLQRRALVGSGGQDTNRRAVGTCSDVITSGAASLHPQAFAAPNSSIIGSADCNGAAHVRIVQDSRTPARLHFAEPASDGFQNSPRGNPGYAEASTEPSPA